MPGPGAAAFKQWYESAWTGGIGCEPELRAGHPEHFVSRAILTPGNAQVVENMGETDFPWLVFYAPLPTGSSFSEPWSGDFPIHFGSQLLDEEGTRIAYTLHQLRDEPEGLRMRLTTYLPAAMRAEIVDRHLRHLCIEFSNWAAIADGGSFAPCISDHRYERDQRRLARPDGDQRFADIVGLGKAMCGTGEQVMALGPEAGDADEARASVVKRRQQRHRSAAHRHAEDRLEVGALRCGIFGQMYRHIGLGSQPLPVAIAPAPEALRTTS